MIFNYNATVPGQMRQWIADTIRRSTYPWDDMSAVVTFDVQAEPPAPGHKDVMCTIGGDGEYTITIRAGVDQPDSRVARSLPNPASDVRTFFAECIAHELSHVVIFELVDNDDLRTQMGALLERDGVMGEGNPPGELEDWNDPDYPWEDRVVEAAAEILKDVILDSRHRIYDNRTNYSLDKDNFAAFLSMLSPHGSFEDRFPGDAIDDAYTLSGVTGDLSVHDDALHLALLVESEDAQAYLTRPDVAPRQRTTLQISLDWPPPPGLEPGWNWAIFILDDEAAYSTAGLHFLASATFALQAAEAGNTYAVYLSTVEGEELHSVDTGFLDTSPALDGLTEAWLTLEERDDGNTYAGLWSTEPPEAGEEGDLAWISVPSAVDVSVRYLGIWLHTQYGEARTNLLRTGGEPSEFYAPWPYEDPTISGGQTASGVMRFS